MLCAGRVGRLQIRSIDQAQSWTTPAEAPISCREPTALEVMNPLGARHDGTVINAVLKIVRPDLEHIEPRNKARVPWRGFGRVLTPVEVVETHRQHDSQDLTARGVKHRAVGLAGNPSCRVRVVSYRHVLAESDPFDSGGIYFVAGPLQACRLTRAGDVGHLDLSDRLASDWIDIRAFEGEKAVVAAVPGKGTVEGCGCSDLVRHDCLVKIGFYELGFESSAGLNDQARLRVETLPVTERVDRHPVIAD